MEYKNGEVVLFSTVGGLKTGVGMILKHKDNGNYVVLTQYNSAYKDIKPEWISPVDSVQEERNYVNSQYAEKINDKQKLIRKVTQEEKDKDRETQYRELQQQIKVIAKRLSESEDDIDFENRLKAIVDMKKNIFSIELECVSDIRKDNGKVKYEIRELERMRDAELNKISDENINKAFIF